MMTLNFRWQSIFRMTGGDDNKNYGDRVAAVFFHKDGGLMITSAVNDDTDYKSQDRGQLKINEWNNIIIAQEFEGTKLMYKVAKFTLNCIS